MEEVVHLFEIYKTIFSVKFSELENILFAAVKV
jgi:hypothetical protein